MFTRLVLLSALALFPSAHAIAFPAPLPTDAQHVTSEPPQPTVGLQLNLRDYDDDWEPDATQTYDNLCGWYTTRLWGIYYDEEELSCSLSSTCVFHDSNSAFPTGMQGCCNGRDCNFATACYAQTDIDATSSLISPKQPFTVYCTDGEETECGTYSWGSSYVRMGCKTTAWDSSMYTKAIWATTSKYSKTSTSTYSKTLTLSTTTVDDDFMNKVFLRDLNREGFGTPTESKLATSSSQPTTSSSSTEQPGKSESTNTGAIAGGVVGGIAAGAALTGAAVFFFLRRKKKTQADPSGSNETDYQAVPQSQSHHSSWLMQNVSEPEPTYKPEGSEGSTVGTGRNPNPPDPLAELPGQVNR